MPLHLPSARLLPARPASPTRRHLGARALLAAALLVISVPAQAGPSPLHISGNQIVDSDGKPVRLMGVNVPSLEWGDGEPNAYSQPKPCWSGQNIRDTVSHALTEWHVNLIRLPINPDRWWSALGNDGKAYRALVDEIVGLVEQHGAYINIDLHWSNAGAWGQNQGQHKMPDANTQRVLADVAGHFANRAAVLIGAYNEPHDIDWDTWKHGGQVWENGLQYQTPGMQAMVQTVRAAGADNIVVVGGLDWAYDLTGLLDGHAIEDDNVLYDSHVYPFKGHEAQWDEKVTAVADRFAVYIGEFGAFDDNAVNAQWSDPAAYVTAIKAWLTAHHYSYSAWTMAPVAPPSLLADWCYTPSSVNGAALRGWIGH